MSVTSVRGSTESETKTAGFLAAKAEWHRSQRRFEEALESGRASLALNGDYSSGHLVVGRCFLEMGEPSQALEHLGRAVEIDGENAVALKLLGDALAVGGFGDEARAAYERATTYGEQQDEIALALRIVSASARSEGLPERGARAETGTVSEEGPELGEISRIDLEGEFETATMARICEEQGIFETALRIYDSLLDAHPDDSLLVGKVARLKRRLAEVGEGETAER